MKKLIFLAGLLALLSACAENPTQEAALLLVDQIDSYQTQVQAKIKAEQQFYRDIRTTFKMAAGRQAWVEQRLVQRAGIIELTDQAIVLEKGMRVTLLQDFLREQNKAARTRKADLDARTKELEDNYRTNFDKLSLQQQQLAMTRSKLLSLAQEQNTKELLIAHVKEAAKIALEEEQARVANENSQDSTDDGD